MWLLNISETLPVNKNGAYEGVDDYLNKIQTVVKRAPLESRSDFGDWTVSYDFASRQEAVKVGSIVKKRFPKVSIEIEDVSTAL